jgi:hypothetical protein
MLPGCKPGQRLGSVDITKDFDAVLMVLLNENFDAFEIYEAERADVLRALAAPGSKAATSGARSALTNSSQSGGFGGPKARPRNNAEYMDLDNFFEQYRKPPVAKLEPGII